MENKVSIDETIIKILPNTYDSVLQMCLQTYNNENSIIPVFYKVLLYIPGSFIHLTLIYDLSVKNNKIADELNVYIAKNAIIEKNTNLLVNLIFNIFCLEKLHYYKEEETEKLLTKNNLLNLFDNIKTSEEYQKNIITLRSENNEHINCTLNDIVFEIDVVNNINVFCNEFNEYKMVVECLNWDFVVTIQTIDTFIFSASDCKFFLLNYFTQKNFTQLIFAMFFCYKRERQTFLLCLFLELAKQQNFLKTFYNEYYNLKNSLRNTKNEDCYNFVNIVMALLYERFYFPSNETYSTYKEACDYDPMYSKDEKSNYMTLLDSEVVGVMNCFSQKDYLRDNLPERLHQYIAKESIFEETNNELKTYIKNKEYEKIKEMSKEQFFSNFFDIAKYSISHFLTYLEILQDYFVLTKEEQEMFCNMFLEKYEVQNNSYKKFVAKKLILFNIIDLEIQEKYSKLFVK